jgi:drug/metabolite transporter (DMT)-like permease
MHAATKKVMGPVEWALLLTLSILWGGSFFFGKVALADLPPFTVVFGRVALGAVALNLVVRATGNRMPGSLSMWAAFAGMGILNNLVPFCLITWGQTQIASGLASILNSTTPLFTAVLAHFLTKDERLTANRLGGVLFGMLGVAVMIGPDVLGGLRANVLAQAAVLGAALSYACAGLYGRRFRGVSPLVTAAGQVTATAVMMLPLTLIVNRPWTLPVPGTRTWLAIGGLGLLCTALAYVIYFRILKAAGATNLLLVTFLIPVSALILGSVLLGERLELRHFGGMALIALGLASIDGRPLRFMKQMLTPKPFERLAESSTPYELWSQRS